MSEPVPRPESLVRHTIKTLRKQILAGRFRDNLPGEPRLASELGVSRGTLRKALEVLEAEGFIAPRQKGKSRQILQKSKQEKEPETRVIAVLISRSLETLPLGTQLYFRGIEAMTRQEGFRFVYHQSLANRLERPARRLTALLSEHQADLWLLHEASRSVARFFKAAGIPAIICGGPSPDVGLSICGFDGPGAIRHAIGIFARAGHRNIVMATRFPRPRREKVIRAEFEKRDFDFSLSQHMPCWENDLEKLEKLLFERLQADDRPTAWILNGLDALIMMFSTLMTLGLKVPQDISILSMGSDPMLACFRPPVSHYSSPHRTLAQAIAGMIREELSNPNRPPCHRRLETEYIKGGSVASIKSSSS